MDLSKPNYFQPKNPRPPLSDSEVFHNHSVDDQPHSGLSLAALMPIPSRTLARGHPWPTICRAYLYEGIERADILANLGHRSARTVRNIRHADRWREYRELAATKATADRHGLSLPWLLREQQQEGQLEIERDERAVRAGVIREELHAVMACMKRENRKDSVEYGRLVTSVAALQLQLDQLLGLDVAKRVAASASIARNKAAISRPRSRYQPGFPRPAARIVQPTEPDVANLVPLD